MNKPEWFPFYVHKFLASANVGRMTVEGVGAYILLLCVAWHQEPAGSLPDDDQALSVWARMRLGQWQRVRDAVLRAFEKRPDGRWHQPTMVREAERAATISAARSKSGRSGGRGNKANAEQLQGICLANAQQTESKHTTTPVVVCVPVPGSDSDSDAGARGNADIADPRLDELTGCGISFGVAQKLIRDHNTPLELVREYVEQASQTTVRNRAAYVRAAIAGSYAPRQTGGNAKASEANEQAEIDAAILRGCARADAKRAKVSK